MRLALPTVLALCFIGSVLCAGCRPRNSKSHSAKSYSPVGKDATAKTAGNLVDGGLPPIDGGGGQGGSSEDPCPRIVIGPQYTPKIVPGNPYLATADANYIPFKGGVARVAYNTVSVQLRDIVVGQIAPVATDRETQQTILAGVDYAMNESVGLVDSRYSGGQVTGNPIGTDAADTLYIAGIGFPSQARGLGGFEWTRTIIDGRDAAIVRSPGSANNAILFFEANGSPRISKTGYSKISEIRSAQGVVTKYNYLSQWDVVIETTHPIKGTIVTKYTRQPSDIFAQFTVLKTIEVGNTIIEQAKYVFAHRPGTGTFALAKYQDLRTLQEFEASYGARGSIPHQYASRAHTDLDSWNGDLIPSFDGLKTTSSFQGLAIKGSAGAYQQSPGTTPFFTMSASELVIDGRQYFTGGDEFRTDFADTALNSGFIDYTNPRNALRIRQFPDNWQQRIQNWPATDTVAGIKTVFEYNDVGAVTKVANVFSSGAQWSSVFTRDAYWLNGANLYNGITTKIVGDPLYPSEVIMTTALGTYTARLQWQKYEQNSLSQMLLTNYSETAPNGSTSSISLAWNNDVLTSITDNNGIKTTFSDTAVTMYDATGLEMLQTQMEKTFASYRAALPTGFTFSAVLNQGVLSRLATLNGTTLSQSKTNLGEATSTPGSFTTRSATGTESNAAGDQSTTSSETNPGMTSASNSGPRGDFLARSSNASTQSLAGSCPLVTSNGITTSPGACSQTFVTEKSANPSYAAPGLGIDNSRITKEGEKYYLYLSYSQNATDQAAVLLYHSPALVKAQKFKTLEFFSPRPPVVCVNEMLTLPSVQKAYGLKCQAVRTGQSDGNDGLPPSPSEVKCEIHRDDACPGPNEGLLRVVLAAGVTKPVEDETMPYLVPPVFEIGGYSNGFQGLFSNIWTVLKNPSVCDEGQ